MAPVLTFVTTACFAQGTVGNPYTGNQDERPTEALVCPDPSLSNPWSRDGNPTSAQNQSRTENGFPSLDYDPYVSAQPAQPSNDFSQQPAYPYGAYSAYGTRIGPYTPMTGNPWSAYSAFPLLSTPFMPVW